jgi:hypothetical protein
MTTPNLVRPADLLAAYPAIKDRTLRLWIQQATPREVIGKDGRPKTLPGNGLGRAVIRRGRVTLIDADLFREWLYEGCLERSA